MLHTTAQIWLGRFDQRMNVIWHPAKSQHDLDSGKLRRSSLAKISRNVHHRETTSDDHLHESPNDRSHWNTEVEEDAAYPKPYSQVTFHANKRQPTVQQMTHNPESQV